MYMWEANLVAVTHVLVAEAFHDGIISIDVVFGHISDERCFKMLFK